MALLPSQGGSEGTWGTELNAWLRVEHSATGTHDMATFMATLSTKLLFNLKGEIMVKRNGELVYN